MSQAPRDRPDPGEGTNDPPRPEIYVIVGKNQFPRPALETFFADAGQLGATNDVSKRQGCSCDLVGGIFCECNKVSTCGCVPVCTCQAVSTCSCVGHINRSGGGGYGCRCAPVH